MGRGNLAHFLFGITSVIPALFVDVIRVVWLGAIPFHYHTRN